MVMPGGAPPGMTSFTHFFLASLAVLTSPSASHRCGHGGRFPLAQRTTHQEAARRRAERCETADGPTPAEKEEWNDRSGGAEEHGQVRAGRVRSLPIEPANRTSESTRQEDCRGDVEIEVGGPRQRIIQAPEHHEEAD